MIIKEISASFSATVQIVQYEPIKFFSCITAEIGEDEDRALCQAQLFEMAKKDVQEQVVIAKNKKNTRKSSGIKATQ